MLTCWRLRALSKWKIRNIYNAASVDIDNSSTSSHPFRWDCVYLDAPLFLLFMFLGTTLCDARLLRTHPVSIKLAGINNLSCSGLTVSHDRRPVAGLRQGQLSKSHRQPAVLLQRPWIYVVQGDGYLAYIDVLWLLKQLPTQKRFTFFAIRESQTSTTFRRAKGPEEYECPVCLGDKDKWLPVQCSDNFCYDCVLDLMKRKALFNKPCPLCQASMKFLIGCYANLRYINSLLPLSCCAIQARRTCCPKIILFIYLSQNQISWSSSIWFLVRNWEAQGRWHHILAMIMANC